MARYEFVDVPVKGGLKAGKTDAFEECKEIVAKKAEDGWELVQRKLKMVGNWCKFSQLEMKSLAWVH